MTSIVTFIVQDVALLMCVWKDPILKVLLSLDREEMLYFDLMHGLCISWEEEVCMRYHRRTRMTSSSQIINILTVGIVVVTKVCLALMMKVCLVVLVTNNCPALMMR